jgi:hypothetical protein
LSSFYFSFFLIYLFILILAKLRVIQTHLCITFFLLWTLHLVNLFILILLGCFVGERDPVEGWHNMAASHGLHATAARVRKAGLV